MCTMGVITLYGIFPGDGSCKLVQGRLTARRYVTDVERVYGGGHLLTVTTRPFLRAEVEGLIWLGGGRLATASVAAAMREARVAS
jgi:hypothetical protein